MRVTPVEIKYHRDISIFASEKFLKSVGDEYGWLGGYNESGKLCCVLPYTIIRKGIFRMVRFRVETIPMEKEIGIEEEKAFLNGVTRYFRLAGADMIIPATTNTIFRTYPNGADAAPYGSYIIDLSQPEDILWRNISGKTRQNINTARKKGVNILSDIDDLEPTYMLIRDTFKRSRIPFMSYDAFKRYLLGLGENGKILIADYHGVVQSYAVFAFSDYCAYGVYNGNIADQHQGATKLLYWESICLFKKLGIKRYDFVGARIDPEKGSKQEAINSVKRHFGAKLVKGYMWKYSLHHFKYRLYCLAARLRSGGDIVDAERHKLIRKT
jgi:hypothetical protein